MAPQCQIEWPSATRQAEIELHQPLPWAMWPTPGQPSHDRVQRGDREGEEERDNSANRTAVSNKAIQSDAAGSRPPPGRPDKQGQEKKEALGRKGKSCGVDAMAGTSGPRWRRRSGRTEVGECPKQVSHVNWPSPKYTCEYIGLGCVSNWAVRVGASYVNV